MARKKKVEAPAGPKRLPSEHEVKTAVAEASRQKAHAAEYAGLAGQATKTFTERYGIHRKAFGWATSLEKMDDQKRQSCIRDFLVLADRLGYFDQTDMFDNLGEKVGAAVSDAGIGGEREDGDGDDVAAKRAARTAEELELGSVDPQIGTTVTERLAEQEQWDTAGEIAEAKKAVQRKSSKPATEPARIDEINASRPN